MYLWLPWRSFQRLRHLFLSHAHALACTHAYAVRRPHAPPPSRLSSTFNAPSLLANGRSFSTATPAAHSSPSCRCCPLLSCIKCVSHENDLNALFSTKARLSSLTSRKVLFAPLLLSFAFFRHVAQVLLSPKWQKAKLSKRLCCLPDTLSPKAAHDTPALSSHPPHHDRPVTDRQVREEWRAEVERSLKKVNQLGSANGTCG